MYLKLQKILFYFQFSVIGLFSLMSEDCSIQILEKYILKTVLETLLILYLSICYFHGNCCERITYYLLVELYSFEIIIFYIKAQ